MPFRIFVACIFWAIRFRPGLLWARLRSVAFGKLNPSYPIAFLLRVASQPPARRRPHSGKAQIKNIMKNIIWTMPSARATPDSLHSVFASQRTKPFVSLSHFYYVLHHKHLSRLKGRSVLLTAG